ncbi:hypothetical protein EVAR_44283_1 [Eumeta japonica]|uniref:Uncharacterized protein n=1 Tax=Eumeta variegata TaxID=151549 RepID=A0A4C1WRV1_EUMVA|nr:hypothetical protein EVAR_44283_1 [Eumeta japonica]
MNDVAASSTKTVAETGDSPMGGAGAFWAESVISAVLGYTEALGHIELGPLGSHKLSLLATQIWSRLESQIRRE